MSKLFVRSTEMSDTKFVTTRAKRRCGETPGQERHSGRAVKKQNEPMKGGEADVVTLLKRQNERR